jgi:hypothetical protein
VSVTKLPSVIKFEALRTRSLALVDDVTHGQQGVVRKRKAIDRISQQDSLLALLEEYGFEFIAFVVEGMRTGINLLTLLLGQLFPDLA